MNSTEQGFFFETLAKQYLEQQGLSFVGRNINGRFGELDLIMKDQAQLVFVEVKARSAGRYAAA